MNLIEHTLERVVARAGDPKDLIYERLFSERPDFQEMFVMDKDGGVQANMLTTCIECFRGVANQSNNPQLQLDAARLHHDGYGVTADDIDLMFKIIRDEFQQILAEEWTPEIETIWSDALATLAKAERGT